MTKDGKVGNWIVVHRSLCEPDHHMGGGPVCPRFAWIDLIAMASHDTYHKPVKMTVVTLERGELLASLRYLANRWGWSKNKVSRFLLEITRRKQIVEKRGTAFGTVYRIVNYDTYQKPWDVERDRDGTGAGQQRDKDNTLNTLNAPNTYEKDFSIFWERYPRKVGKQAALKNYRARMRAGVDPGEILAGLDRYIHYLKATKTAERFVLHPKTFLGPNEYWEEAYTIPETENVDEGDEPVLDSKFKTPFVPVIEPRKKAEDVDDNHFGNIEINF